MSATETTIHVTLPDGSAREVPRGTTALDIARSISPRLADAALVAKIKPQPSALGAQHSAPEQSGSPSAEPTKAPASMHAAPSKDGWQFADLTRPLEQDVELR